MWKILFVSILFIGSKSQAQYDMALINRVFEYVLTDKFRQEYIDSFTVLLEKDKNAFRVMTKKQKRKYRRSFRPHNEEYYNNLYKTYLQNTCLRSSPGYCIPNATRPINAHSHIEDSLSGIELTMKDGFTSRIYKPLSGNCNDTLDFYACFLQPDIIELRHFYGTRPFGSETRLRFRINPDKSIIFIRRVEMIYN